jgi:cell cycle checkpoint protein
MKHKTLVSDPSVRSGSNNDEAWSTRYPPKSINELCVHKKKISEVQKWLEDAFSIQRGIPSSDQSMILLLTGPSGCGKSAVVHALSHEMPFSILEWTNPVTLPNDLLIDHEFNQSQIKQFTNFILRGNRYPSLSLSSSSTAPKESKVVLIEELPNAIIREPSKLHQLLESIKISSSPLIFIVSSNQTSSLGPSHIFPSRILSLHNIHTISFNPVAHTGLIKGLQRILALEGALPRLPYKEVIDDIATSCGGDIRNAINSLQFVWLKKDVSDLFMRSDKENMTDDRREEMRPIGGRDFPLYLFRALGKILYCKRGATPSHYLPPHLSHYDRHDLTAEPEVVYESVNMSCDMFNLYIHQNYIDFFEDIYDTALAIDYISYSDMISSTWTESQVQRSSLEKCGASLCCRGYMFANAHPVGHRWKPLHKPQWNTINRQVYIVQLYWGLVLIPLSWTDSYTMD